MSLNIERGEFPKNVIEQAGIAAKIRASSYLSKRLDLRGKTIFSFSESSQKPAECGFSLYRKGFGWQLGVHIADVCEYVCEDSPLDTEARKRYAAIDNGIESSAMLPEKITHDLCDLSCGGDKLALSILLDIASDGALRTIQLEESIIRVTNKCVYSEIDQLGLARDASSVMMLREKYEPLLDMLQDMYELAARFCSYRRERGGLDNIFFRNVYERNAEGKITAFRRESEPDSRAMVREIGYFVAEAVGKYVIDNKLPCIFIGQETLPEYTLNYLTGLVGAHSENKSLSEIDDLAKGSPYYSLVSDTIMGSLPCASFSDKPIENILCASDRIVSFFRPTTRYTDLLSLRALKTSIQASGNPQNLNLKRQRKINSEAAAEANKAERFVFETQLRLARQNALSFLENCGDILQKGFPIMKMHDGTIRVILDCGVKAIVPPEASKGFDFASAMPYMFEVIHIGTVDKYTLVKPAV